MRSVIADKMTCKPFKIALAVFFGLIVAHIAYAALYYSSFNGTGGVRFDTTGGALNVYVCSHAYGSSIASVEACASGYTGSPTLGGIYNYPGGGSYLYSNSFGGDCLSFDCDIVVVGGSGTEFYEFDTSGYVPPAPVNTSTHIVRIIPENGTTTASTTAIGAEVYINSNDLSSTTAYNPQIQMTLTSPDNGTNLTFYFPSAAGSITTAGDQTFSATTTLQDGLYNVTTLLTVPPFGQFPGQAYDSTTTSFIVNESTFLALQSSQYGIATTTCNVSNIAGCFQNALVYLFWPNASAIASYSTFQALIYQKPPVGYFSLVQNALNGVTSTSSTSSIPWSSGTLSYGGSVFSSLRLGIAGILWFFFLIEFWHRIRNIKI